MKEDILVKEHAKEDKGENRHGFYIRWLHIFTMRNIE